MSFRASVGAVDPFDNVLGDYANARPQVICPIVRMGYNPNHGYAGPNPLILTAFPSR